MIQSTPADTQDELEEAFGEDIHLIKKKTVSGVVSYFIRTGFMQAIGLVSAALLSAFLSIEDFGIYGFVTQIIGILVFFSDIGLAASLVQKKEEPSVKEYQTVFTIQQLLSWVIVLLSFAFVATGFVEQKVGMAGVAILLSLAFSFPLATFKTISSIRLERRLEFSKLVVPQIIEQLAFQGILLFLAWNGHGVWSYTWAIVVRAVLGAIVAFWIEPWPIGIAIDRQHVKTLLLYGSKFQLNDFLARIKDSFFYLLLGVVLPLREYGYVSWAKQWSMYPYNLTVQNVMAVTFPTFSRLQHNKDALRKAIEKSLFFITVSIFPILIGMAVFISPLLKVIPQYEKWQPASLSFALFALSIGWSAISTPLTNTLNALGHIHKTLKLMVLWTVLTWTLTPVMMYFWGYDGVALASFMIAFSSVLPVLYVKKIVDFSFWEQVWRQLLASAAMTCVGLIGLDVWSKSIYHVLAGMLIAGTTYLSVFLIFGFEKLQSELLSLRSK